MNIGILTFHGSDNYGSVLQAYALATFLNKTNAKAEIIDYYFEHDYRQYKVFRTYRYRTNPKAFVADCISFVPHLRRRHHFASFRSKYLPLSDKKITTAEELSSLAPKYDAFICGSDQIWNLNCTDGVTDAFFLRFVDSGKKKIAYAPSMGSYSLQQKDMRSLQEALSDFDAISVREPSMVDIINQIDPEAHVQAVLDPTMLLTATDYEKELINGKINEHYIFVYILGGSKTYTGILDHARIMAKQKNCKIRYIIDNNNALKRLQGKDCSGCSPCDFLMLIRDAEYVLTNSFHATVFSILFHKQFTSFGRGLSTSRVTDLLHSLDLDHCFWSTEKEQFSCVNTYERVDSILEKKREKSIAFLNRTLGIRED